MFICSFSGAVADLPKKSRDAKSVLKVLVDSPRISTWDMSENEWLWPVMDYLQREELIVEKDEPYPWLRYEVTENGKLFIDDALPEADEPSVDEMRKAGAL